MGIYVSELHGPRWVFFDWFWDALWVAPGPRNTVLRFPGGQRAPKDQTEKTLTWVHRKCRNSTDSGGCFLRLSRGGFGVPFFYPGRPRAQKVSYIYPIGIMITILILRTMIMLRLIPSLYRFLLAYYYHSCYRYYYRSPPSPIYMPMTMRVPSWEVYSCCIYIL